MCTSRAPTARSTRTSAATRRGCVGCSASSRFREASPATPRRRRRDRSARAATLDEVVEEIGEIQRRARSGARGRPRWPMIVLRTLKGWTGPKEVDGLPVEGTFRAHQVPLAELTTKPEHLVQLEEWLRSYEP